MAWGVMQCAHAAAPEVVIDPGGVPPEALQAITGAVGAITRLAEDQDGGEVSRLRRRAHAATLSALETQGYFSPNVTLEVGQDVAGETWDIIIEPGELTHVDQVNLDFKGQITRPDFVVRVEGLKSHWPLKSGMPFINQSWGSAKTGLLDDVSRKDFYFAKLAYTQATINAEESTADLAVSVDSGPRVRLGEMTVNGLKRVPESLIERYIQYTPGDPYDQDQLDEWQQALQSTSFFRGAFVTLDPDESAREVVNGDELQLPLRVRVSEAPARRVATSIGVDSDHGLRVEGLYRQNVVFGWPVWIETGASVDKDTQRAFFDVHLPPTVNGYKDSFGLLYEHSDIQGVDNRRVGAAWKRKQQRFGAGDSRVEYETEWMLGVAHDKTRIEGGDDYEVPTAVATWRWLRRDVDKKYDPREGNLIDFGLGAGITLDKSEPFYRSSLRLQQWWPIGERDVLTLRGEVGKVWSDTNRLPQDFGYRTGGARTVRGYKYQSLGLDNGDAIEAAPALAVASVQYTHYFTDMFGMNYFVDVGDAAESFGDMDLAVGVGVGLAVRTPAGPFYLDVAYGEREKELRVHFSLGIAF